VKSSHPQVRVFGVETEGTASMSKAWEAGEPVRLDHIYGIAPLGGQVASLGLDETSFLKANRTHPTACVPFLLAPRRSSLSWPPICG